MDAQETTITWLGGVKELKPVEYRVTSYVEGPRWWPQTLWAVESEFGRLSNIATKAEAEAMVRRMRRHR